MRQAPVSRLRLASAGRRDIPLVPSNVRQRFLAIFPVNQVEDECQHDRPHRLNRGIVTPRRFLVVFVGH